MNCDRLLYEQTPAMLQAIDAEGKIVAVSNQWLTTLGYARIDVIGHPWQTFLTAASQRLIAPSLPSACWQTGTVQNLRLQFVKHNGDLLEVSVNANLIRDEAAQPAYCLAILTDMTTALHLEDELQAYRDNLERLIRDRTAELEEANRQLQAEIRDRTRAEQALKGSEERFRLIAETVDDHFWIDDVHQQRPLYDSPKIEEIWGLPAAALAQGLQPLIERVHPEEQAAFAAFLRFRDIGTTPYELTYRVLHPQKGLRWLQTRTFPLLNAQGQPDRVVGVTSDITVQKQTEEALRQYERMIAANPDPICLIGRDYTYRLVNPAFQELFKISSPAIGIPVAQVMGTEFFAAVVHPRLEQALAGVTQTYEEWVHNPRNPVEQFISVSYTPYYEADGTISGVITCIRNLTALKQTRERLEQTTERLRLHIENSPLAVIEWDGNVRVQSWSDQAAVIFGWSAAAAIGKHFSDFPLVAPEDLPLIYQQAQELIQGQQHHQTVLTRNLNRQGQPIHCEWYNSALLDEAGNLISILSFVQDISERMRMQAALQESEERWHLALQGSNAGIWDWKIPTQEVFYSARWKELLGFADAELSNTRQSWDNLVHPEDLPQVKAIMQAHLQGRTPYYQAEYRMRTKAGDYKWISSRGKAIFNAAGKPVRFVGAHSDISDRKQAELALRSSQQLLQLVLDTMPQRVFWKDLEGRFLGCNRAFARDMGHTDPSTIIGKTDNEISALQPESIQTFQAHDQAVLEAGHTLVYQEQPQQYRDGTIRWVCTTKLPLRTEAGALLGIFGCYEDVTDRKQVRESLQRYARMIEVAKEGFCLVDRDYRYQLINRTYEEWYGLGGRPILGHTLAEVLGPEAFEQRLKPLTDRCLRGETIRYAQWFEFPHLGPRYRSVTLTPFVEGEGEITGFVTSISDLTELKQIEARQQELLELVEATPDFVGMATPAGDIVYLNAAAKAVFMPHFERVEDLQSIHQCFPQWVREHLLSPALMTATQQGTWQGESAILTAAGQEIPVSQIVTAHLDERGEVKLFSTIARDIRPQKALEHQLRDRLQFEQLLSRISTEFVNLPNEALNTGIQQALADIAAATGVDRSYVYRLSPDGQWGYLCGQWQQPGLAPIPETWHTVATTPFQWWMTQLQNRQVITIDTLANMPPEATHERLAIASLGTEAIAVVPMFHSQQLMGYIGFSVTQPKSWTPNEITLLRLVGDLFASAYRRQEINEALRRQEHYFRALTERSSDIVALLDADGVFLYVSPSITRQLGYLPYELMGESHLPWVHPEDRDVLLRILDQAAAAPGVSQPLIQYRIKHKDQTWRSFEAIATSLLADPIVQGIVVNCRDVSDRIKAEAAYRRSEQVFQAIFEQTAISMAQIALDGTYIRVNPAFCRLVGYGPAELIGEHYAKVTHPDDLSFDTQLSQEVAAGKVSAHFIDKRFVRSDGDIRYVQVVVTAVLGDQDSPAFLASVYNDITERVAAEHALRSIVEGTAAVVGADFFPVLAQQLTDSLGVDHLLINQLEGDILSTLVHWSPQGRQPDLSYPILHTPCERTLSDRFFCCPVNVQAQFPDDPNLIRLNAESYLGVALIGENGHLLGEICAIHSQPVHNLDNAMAILRIFAARASAELERQRSNQALQENEANFRHILTHMPVLFNAMGEHGCFTFWNRECEQVTGYTATEVIGDPQAFSRFYPDADYLQVMQQQWATVGNNYRNWEWNITCKDGSQRIIAWSNISDEFPIANLETWGIGVDVTERRRAENALRESEARFQRLATNMPGIIYRYHQYPDGRDRFSYVSPSSRYLWELEPEAVCTNAQLIWNLLHPEDVAAFQHSINEAMHQGGQWFHEHRIITPCGQLKWIQGVAKGELDPEGTYTWDGLMIDVTARKTAEMALMASEARFQRLAANMPGMIYRHHRDPDGGDRLSYVSPACREIWGIEPEAALQSIDAVWHLVHPDDRDRLQEQLRHSQTHQVPFFEEYRILLPAGGQKWLQLVARPVLEPTGGCLWDGIIIDITGQKETAQALRESETLNRAILGALPDLLIRMRRDGLCLDVQYPPHFKVACSQEHHIGRYIQDTLIPEVSRERLAATARALETGTIQIYEYQLSVNHQLCWEEARVVPLSADEVLILIRDIDDRKRAEAALQSSEAINRAIVEALPDMLVQMRRDGCVMNISHPADFPALVKHTDALGRNIRDMLPPDVAAQRLALAAQALTTQSTAITDYQIPVNGALRWEESRVVPLTEDEVLVLIRDIDERKRAENEVLRLNQMLETQNQQLEALVEQRTSALITFMNALPDQIFVIDRATNTMTFGNKMVVQFAAKLHRQDFEGKTVFDCFPAEQAAYYDAQNRQVFESGEILHVEESAETEQGIIFLDTYKIPLKDPHGEVYALIGSSRDVTELVRARQTLELQALQLAATNQELQAFSYSVSHDLRAPLRHINGFIAALKQRLGKLEQTDSQIAHYIDVIEKSSQKMGLLIDGLLTLSRVGRRELALRLVPMQPLVDHAIALLEHLPLDAPEQLQLTVDDLSTVYGDPTLLQQVWTNLIGNAVKFSRDRRPAIIHIGQRTADGAFFVQDNGVGFDMAYADKLFSPFQRLHQQTEFEGTGIGLAIVNRIIHRHGGRIWVESVLGQGTTFFFTLPAGRGDPPVIGG